MNNGPQWALAEARTYCHDDLAALVPDAPSELVEAECMFIIRSWTEPHRAYHGLRHVADMLGVLRRLGRASSALNEHSLLLARMATWYHDVTYDPRATPGSNEQRSATFARDHLHRLGADSADVDTIEALVLMTADHRARSTPEDLPDELLDVFHDADLWILSSPAQRYREYARQVRDEYAHVPAPLFASGRSIILRGFLERDHVYRTPYARAHWESSARANLAAEITRLE